MRTILTLCALFLIRFAGFAQTSFTLDEAIQYALSNSINIASADLDIKDADLQIRELKAIGLPQINGSTNYRYNTEIPGQPTEDFISPAVVGILNANNVTPDPIPDPEVQVFQIPFGLPHNFDVGITADMLLFDGSYLVALRSADTFRELIRRQKDQTVYDTRVAVTQAYINVLINKRNYDILLKNIDNLSKTVRETEIIYSEGFVEKLDVDRLKLSLSNLQADAQSLHRVIDFSKNILKLQMNYPQSTNITLSDDIEGLILTKAVQAGDSLDYSYTDRPEYQLLKQNEIISGLSVDRYQQARWPVVRAFGAFQRGIQDNDWLFGENIWIPTSYVGLSVSIPIYDGGDKKAKIQRARVEVDKIRNQQRLFEQAMDMEVQNGQLLLDNALATLNNREQSMNLAQEIYDVAQIKYREGVGSSIELTQAEQSFYQAEQTYISSLFEVLSAHVELQKSLGKL